LRDRNEPEIGARLLKSNLWRRLLARVAWVLLAAWPAAVGSHRLTASEDSESDAQASLDRRQ